MVLFSSLRRASRPSQVRPRWIAAWAGLALTASCSPPSAELETFWNQHDAESRERVDHSAWQTLLDAYLTPDATGVHLFDYAALEASAGDRDRLAGYLEALQELDPRRLSASEAMAYWINLYNALTVRVVVDHYPVDSIRQIHRSLVPLSGPWGDVLAVVAGRELTLDDIEHRILRPIWRDPRIHYAVNCAARGCPNLSARVFTGKDLEELLDEGARTFINHPRGVEIPDASSAVLSSIYEWYREDFGETDAELVAHLLEYANKELAESLEGFAGRFEFAYDWSLNEPRGSASQP